MDANPVKHVRYEKIRPLEARKKRDEATRELIDSYGRWLAEHKGHQDEAIVRRIVRELASEFIGDDFDFNELEFSED